MRALAWLAVRLPRSLVRATPRSGKAPRGRARRVLAASRRYPDAAFLYHFQDFLTLYVVAFVALDVYAPKVLGPALRLNGVARGQRGSVSAPPACAGQRCEPRFEEAWPREVFLSAILGPDADEAPILAPVRAPPLVVPTKRSKVSRALGGRGGGPAARTAASG